MQKYENDCCGCATESYPCLDSQCSLTHVLHLYCDECGEEADTLYIYDEQELCEECLLKQFTQVNV